MNALYVLSVLLFSSVAVNITLYLKLRRDRKTPVPSIEAKDLLHDITSKGAALVRIQVLDPEGLFLTRGGR